MLVRESGGAMEAKGVSVHDCVWEGGVVCVMYLCDCAVDAARQAVLTLPLPTLLAALSLHTPLALHDFKATAADELSFSKGDTLKVRFCVEY